MTASEFETLREKDRAVLRHIDEGNDDVQHITAATTLENHEVNYCFRKLEDQGLIEVEKPDGMVERVIDGQKRVFEAPKQARPTEKGERCLDQAPEGEEKYEEMTRDELVETVRELEARIADLRRSFEVFREQVRRKMRDDS